MYHSKFSSTVSHLTEFIEMYKNLTLLWDKHHPHYKNRRLRLDAYKNLFKTYKALDSEASMADMKKKIDVIRNNYSRELKKVRRSKLNGGPEYIPTLWYYNLLSFLEKYIAINECSEDTGLIAEYASSGEDHANQGSRYNNEYKDPLDEQNNSVLKVEYLDDSDSTVASDHQLAYKSSHKLARLESHTHDSDTHDMSSREDHKWAVIGKSIAVQLQDLDPMQAIIAQKLISDTLYYAKLGRLNETVRLSLGPENT